MTAKEYLSQARNLNRKINTKKCELQELRETAYSISAINYSSKVQSSSKNNSNKAIDKIVDMEAEINAEIDKLVDLKREINKTIENLENDTYKQVLTLRYVCCYSFEKCADIMGYSIRWVFKVHKEAIRTLKDSIDL